MKKFIAKILLGILITTPTYAIDIEQIEFFGYGSFLYKNFDYLQNYQQDPKNKTIMDFERFVISPRFILDDETKIVTEIEFEHGGTGSTMEYDTLEEFGEFEAEIEKGGEVAVEEAYLEIKKTEWLNFKIGHMILPVGLNTQRHLPTLYLSTQRNASETAIMPNTWHETGVLLFGKFFDNVNYQVSLTNGLNSEYFSSQTWIQAGHQKRFEFVNANSLATAIRIDYGNLVGSHFGFSAYTGNTGKNRNKSELDVDAQVTILDIHGVYDERNVKLRGMAMLGKLTDSEAVTISNKALPSALEAKKSPVASGALAYFLELGYDISPLFDYSKAIVPFVKYDFVDSMYETEGSIPDSDRYERKISTIGINYFYTPSVVYKADYSTLVSGDENIEDMNSFALSLGFQY